MPNRGVLELAALREDPLPWSAAGGQCMSARSTMTRVNETASTVGHPYAFHQRRPNRLHALPAADGVMDPLPMRGGSPAAANKSNPPGRLMPRKVVVFPLALSM
jgi:hypothetical protein